MSLLQEAELLPQRRRVGPVDGPDGPFFHPVQGRRGGYPDRHAFERHRLGLEIFEGERRAEARQEIDHESFAGRPVADRRILAREDRKSTRLNSSHEWISYAV